MGSKEAKILKRAGQWFLGLGGQRSGVKGQGQVSIENGKMYVKITHDVGHTCGI